MNPKIEQLINNIEKVILGKRDVIIKIICAMLAEGHVLIEDVPGVGKTLLAETLAKSVSGSFRRIQFTPDLMPSDVIGYTAIDMNTGKSEYKEGAAMCNFLLADEINRTSPKVQSALLEAMEEKQISVDGVTHALPVPFMTLATQNPIETYGTYHLPEAQLDRFLMRVSMGYPDRASELAMLDVMPQTAEVSAVMTLDELIVLRGAAKNVSVSEQIKAYILAVVGATRNDPQLVKLGASPRASIALFKAAQAMALINARSFVTPDDVKSTAVSVLSHRLILASGQQQFGSAEQLVEKILNDIPVPV
ncbi:MAG: MoxR family ATPase [Oscillospiraceae bacterium]|nr:MoxR family ATPase [Oscillospiraceae bacterium]